MDIAKEAPLWRVLPDSPPDSFSNLAKTFHFGWMDVSGFRGLHSFKEIIKGNMALRWDKSSLNWGPSRHSLHEKVRGQGWHQHGYAGSILVWHFQLKEHSGEHIHGSQRCDNYDDSVQHLIIPKLSDKPPILLRRAKIVQIDSKVHGKGPQSKAENIWPTVHSMQ